MEDTARLMYNSAIEWNAVNFGSIEGDEDRWKRGQVFCYPLKLLAKVSEIPIECKFRLEHMMAGDDVE